MSKVWFVTGTSKGFGRVWAEAALERGDRVVATARDKATLAELVERHGENVLALTLDVTDKAAVEAAVKAGHEHFGRLDIVVNNAGYGLFGTIEEQTEELIRAQMETNFFGAMWVTKAVLPILREQGSGHILQVSSIGGVNAWPITGVYHASKWALEAFSQSLAGEVAPFGINVTIVEPTGSPPTGPARPRRPLRAMEAYDPIREARKQRFTSRRAGDPQATGAAILELVDADEPPLRLFLGEGNLEMINDDTSRRLATWAAWDSVAVAAQGGALMSFDTTAAEAIAGIDLTGKRAIVTGGASGIGVETARALAGAGAEVTLAVRDTVAGERVATDVGAIAVEYLELAKPESIDGVRRALGRAAAHPRQQRGRDGASRARERRRTGGRCSSRSTTSGTSRSRSACTARWRRPRARGSSSVSSTAHQRSPVVFDDINFRFRPYDPMLAYGQSKTANVLFAVGATQRWADDGIYANALHPGAIFDTGLARHLTPTSARR